MEPFCELIKNARENKGLLLRQVSLELKIDQAIISKLERGERKPSKDHIIKFSNLYNLDAERLIIDWLSDKIASQIENEDFAEKALRLVKQKIQKSKTKI